MNENENENITITKADQALLERYHNADSEIQRAVLTLLQAVDMTGAAGDRGSHLKDQADELQDLLEATSNELDLLRGTLAVLRGIKDCGCYNEDDLSNLFANLANQVETIDGAMINQAICMAMTIRNAL